MINRCCSVVIERALTEKREQIPTMSGREIAEWVMKNHETLNVKYVIWGQRIWESTEKEKGWTSWKPMEDRKSITQNHW